MVNVATVFSTLGNPNSLWPLAIKDTASSAGMTVASYVTGKEEGYDRLIDEGGTEGVWLCSIPAYKYCYDKTIFKAIDLDSKFDARNLKDKTVLEKAKEYAPTKEVKNNIEKIMKNESLFKKAATGKFLASTALAIGTYIGLTRWKQNYTENKIRKNLLAEHNEKQAKEKEAKNNNLENPNFKGLGSVVESFAFSPVKNMWILDGSITAERLADSRNTQELVGYAIKEASLLFFLYYAGGKIQEIIENKAAKKGKPINLDARVLEDKNFQKAFENNEVEKSLEEFKKANTSDVALYEFLHKNPDNLVVKTAKKSDIIGMYKEPQGLFKKSKVTDKIDTRKFIDLNEVKGVNEKIEQLYKEYKKALQNGDTSDKFFNGIKNLKRKSIITNIATCIFALGVVTPGIMLAKRLLKGDDKEFQTKKDIREQMIKEGLIA
ncbi:MAG: hypothetical protein E7Z89_05615 [Cyanobacteria bacterium SIG28]|nr:hypothetical protein [Cyanobacteria bacterium SIG28]